jgi:peptide/nickel transport system permease protein
MCDSLSRREPYILSSLFLLWCTERPAAWTIKSSADLGWSRAVQKYLLRRILYGLLTLFGVSVIIFVVMRILPGDPLVAMFGMEGFMKLSDADRTRIMEDLGLSDPLLVQYVHWLKDIASGSFGKSFFRGESVAEIILHRGPLSAEIGIFSVVISWMIGLPVGIISAFRPNSVSDHVARSISILFLAIPGFWLGMLTVLALLFWFNYKAPLLVVHLWQDPWLNCQLVIGPAIVLGLGQGAYIARMSRSCLLEVIREDYVRTARAKGVTEWLVVIRHTLPNALLPVITLSGILMGFVLGGSVAIEQAFGVPGLGRTLVTAVIERDIIVVQNLVFLYGIIFILINLMVDLSYAWLDPRIRYQ